MSLAALRPRVFLFHRPKHKQLSTSLESRVSPWSGELDKAKRNEGNILENGNLALCKVSHVEARLRQQAKQLNEATTELEALRTLAHLGGQPQNWHCECGFLNRLTQ
eukprot:6360444-Amphidinium_carterae.1